MLNLKKYSHFFLLAVLAVFVASCEKRDANLTTDFESKKASADKLVTEVNEGLARMDAEHAGMMSDLDSAGKASKDSSRVNAVREDMNRHMEQTARVKALVDSVSVYKAITAENDEQLKAANDRLGTHFDDLSSEWKTLQDQHAKLQQDIQGFAVAAAGDAVVDSAKAAADNGAATTSKSGSGTGTKNPAPAKNSGGADRNSTKSGTGTGTKNPAPAKNSGGAPRNSTSSSGTTTTTTTTTTQSGGQAPAKNSGGETRTSTSTSTTKK